MMQLTKETMAKWINNKVPEKRGLYVPAGSSDSEDEYSKYCNTDNEPEYFSVATTNTSQAMPHLKVNHFVFGKI